MENLTKKSKTEKYCQNLMDSESGYKSLFENSMIGVARISADGRLINVNDSLAILYGFSGPMEMINEVNNVSQLYENPVERAGILRILNEKGEIKPREISMVRRDGTRLSVLVGEKEVRDTGGTVIYYQAEHMDISGRKRREEDLVRNSEQLSLILENSLDLLYRWNLQKRVFDYISPSVVNVLGFTAQEMIHMSTEKVLSLMHTDDMFNFESVMDDSIANQGCQYQIEYRFRHRNDDQYRWLLHRITSVRDENGTPSFIYGSVSDITQRKENEVKITESESRYRNLFEYSDVPIWEQDYSGLQLFFDSLRKKGIKDLRSYFRKHPEKVRYCISLIRIIDVNKISLNFMGVKNKSELTDRLSDFFINESLDILAEEFIAFAEGKNKFEGNIPVKMPHGEIRQLFFRLQVLPDYHNTYSRVLVSWIDITDRLRYEKILEESSMVLRNLNRYIEKAREDERTKISLNLHDDLGQKLTAIKMDFSWLKARVGVQSTIVSEKFASMANSLDEALGTVQRISSDLHPRILYDLGLTAAIEWQLNEFSKTTSIKSIFRVNLKNIIIDDKLSIVVFRLIQESLTNIIRHSRATEVSVNLKYQKDDLNLIIRDNGIGIDQDKLNNQNSYGLMGMKERARAFGGEVKIMGVKGTGTTVHVIIPMSVQ